MERIVLAYSGGFDTTVAIASLKEQRGAEVIAVTMDLGQGRELEAVRDRALAAGALRAHVLDVRDEFARDYVLPSLKADAVSMAGYPMAGLLGRPLIAQKLIEIAQVEQAIAVAHGCRGSGDELGWLESTVRALEPSLTVLAPVRDRPMTRAEVVAYARARGIAAPAAVAGRYRAETNVWGRSIAGRIADDRQEAPEDLLSLTRSPSECPDEPAYVEISFERGVPLAINAVSMPLVDLIASLGTIAGAHGVGRIDTGQNQLAPGNSREILEVPSALVLHAAHRELQALVSSSELRRFARAVSAQYADLVSTGLWFTPLRQALDAFVETVQERVTGVVRLKLFMGDCHIVSRESSFSTDNRRRAAYQPDHDPQSAAFTIS